MSEGSTERRARISRVVDAVRCAECAVLNALCERGSLVWLAGLPPAMIFGSVSLRRWRSSARAA
jgi:hypothetical protein